MQHTAQWSMVKSTVAFLLGDPRPAVKLVCFTLSIEREVWKYYNEVFGQPSKLKYGLHDLYDFRLNVQLPVCCIQNIC